MFTKQPVGAAGASAQAKRAAIPSGQPNFSILASGFLFNPTRAKLPRVRLMLLQKYVGNDRALCLARVRAVKNQERMRRIILGVEAVPYSTRQAVGEGFVGAQASAFALGQRDGLAVHGELQHGLGGEVERIVETPVALVGVWDHLESQSARGFFGQQHHRSLAGLEKRTQLGRGVALGLRTEGLGGGKPGNEACSQAGQNRISTRAVQQSTIGPDPADNGRRLGHEVDEDHSTRGHLERRWRW